MALSGRGRELAKIGFDHGELDEYDPVVNPNGSVKFLYAENRLMHQQLAEFINKNNTFNTQTSSYGEGYTGSKRLRTAMAVHLNEYFHPQRPLDAEEITFAAGVTALNEACAWALCDPGDAILLGKYNYGAFPTDFAARTGISLVYATFRQTDQFSEACVHHFEEAYEEARRKGTNVRALLLCNPNNPLGRCYTPAALEALSQFCEARDLHLISDEIYALSVYHRPDRTNETFTSVLTVQEGFASPDKVHVLYGFAKDYAAGGLRLGCVISRNEAFTTAVRGGVCRFSSPSTFSMDIATKMLEDRKWIKQYLSDSVAALATQRDLVETLLDDTGLKYSREGNAGLFVWLDLSELLHQNEGEEDGWPAEARLAQRLSAGGVVMSTGQRYQSVRPGNFRMIFSYNEPVLREGIKRIAKVCEEQTNWRSPGSLT